MTSTPVKTRRWTRIEYDRLIEIGIIQEDERLELLAGELVLRDRQTPDHATGIGLDDESEPEPDVSVVPGTIYDYRHTHPSRPTLLVEVADSSLAFDREHKGSLYARARVPEYWIVNLVDSVLEVYREPGPDAAAAYGFAYRAMHTLRAEDHVTPRALPTVRVPVADLLP